MNGLLKNETRLSSEFILGKIEATHDVDAYFEIGHLKAFLDYILHFFELTNSDSSTFNFCYTQERRDLIFYQNPLSRSSSTPKNVCYDREMLIFRILKNGYSSDNKMWPCNKICRRGLLTCLRTRKTCLALALMRLNDF